MKPIWRCLTIGIFASASLPLTGCAQIDTVRQWWRVWRSPVPTSSTEALSPSNVIIDLQEIATHHPAWKLAEQLESSPSTALTLDWSQPGNLSNASLGLPKSTFTANSVSINNNFAEPAHTVVASDMENLTTQMKREQLAAWDEWDNSINRELEEDRQQINRAMRVDLNNQIAQTQKNIPEIGSPLIPTAEIQREMINLRLKLLQNIALSPEEKTATQNRLDQLEAQWAQRLREQAQEGAENQQYWRETVPHQMRVAGEAKIQQTLQALQQRDQQSIELILDSQRQWLAQDTTDKTVFLLDLPAITNRAVHTKSTFRTPVLSAKSIKSTSVPIKAPQPEPSKTMKASRSEIDQLRQIALAAAKNAAMQSASKHHWEWRAGKSQQPSTTADATKIVLQEANFS